MSKRPINCALRNAVWSYPRLVPPRFPGAPTITETARSYEAPLMDELPENAEVEVQFYGGAVTFRLDGWLHRISTERFRWVRFADEAATREAFLELWREVEDAHSAAEVARRAALWYERQQHDEDANLSLNAPRYKTP
jgi:hypothetical protein